MDFLRLEAVSRMLRDYRQQEISTKIAPCEDMYVPGPQPHMDHYLSVGAATIDLLARSMILVGRTEFPTVLDLPCGGGRAMRHMVKFFPNNTRFFAGDVSREKVRAVAEQFGAQPIEFDPQFAAPPAQRFSLIFVGSLLTHLDLEHTERCLRWLIDAITPGGLLIATTNSRAAIEDQKIAKHIPAEKWSRLMRDYDSSGFAFAPDNPAEPVLGQTLIRPSRLISMIENDFSLRYALLDTGWAHAQDALVIRKT